MYFLVFLTIPDWYVQLFESIVFMNNNYFVTINIFDFAMLFWHINIIDFDFIQAALCLRFCYDFVISSRTMEHLYIVKDTLRQDQYKRMWKTRQLPQFKRFVPKLNPGVLLHFSPKIALLFCVGCRIHLSPIENISDLTKRIKSLKHLNTKKIQNVCIESIFWHKEAIVSVKVSDIKY